MRKAQVTLFIIIGIAILIVFLVLFSLTGKFSKEERQEITLAKSKLDTSVVNLYVTNCIKLALNKGIVEISLQGGRIYFGQNGSLLNCTAADCTFAGAIKYENADVSYGLTINPEISAVPKYPCLDNSITWPFCKFYFDVNSKNPLISIFGKETLPLLEGENSIKLQLEEFIEEDVKNCIDFSELGFGNMKIEQGEPEAELNIGASDVTVNLNLPVKIYVDSSAVAESKKFTYSDNIRLRYIYNLISDIIKTDNRLLNYNLASDFSKSKWYRSGMQLAVSYNRKENDDLIILTDQESRINDKPLAFVFARQNLPPVLNYIRTNFSTTLYDEVYLEGQTLEITAQGFDPNEDSLTYSFSGWKIDYDEIFEPSTMRMNKLTPVSNPAIVNNNMLTIPLTSADIGYHNITVSVSDGQYTDYQIVRILVDDKVKLNANGRNPYSDISLVLASVEDPYLFEAATVDYFNPGENIYSWQDNVEGKLYEGKEQSFWLPGNLHEYNSISINNVTGSFNAKALHTIEAKVVAGVVNGVVNQDIKTLSVNVRECLPHRSNIPPYPFNLVESAADSYSAKSADSFMGNHSCCLGTPSGNSAEWRIAPAGTICYEQVEYGALADNDVYKKGAVWRCDGTRGNICGGQKEDAPQVLVEACGNSGGPDGLCQGPSQRAMRTATPQSCTNYYGPDFDNNACSNVKKCSTQSAYNVPGGSLLCQGGCDGYGGCTAPLNFNLCESAASREAIGKCQVDLSAEENRIYSMSCQCAASASGDDSIQCAKLDLDANQNKCIECGISWINSECCGDDFGESAVNGVCSS